MFGSLVARALLGRDGRDARLPVGGVGAQPRERHEKLAAKRHAARFGRFTGAMAEPGCERGPALVLDEHGLLRAVKWQGRVLRERVMRLAWGAALALLPTTLLLVSILLVLGAAYIQIAAAGGTVAGLLSVAALALPCALGAALAARGLGDH